MASSQAEIRDRVRDITDYDSQIVTNPDLDDIINIAEDEIRSDLGDPSFTFYQGTDTFNIDLALMWLAALFAKIKTGEIDGPTMTLGELRARPLSGSASIWMERFERRISAHSGTRGYGRTEISRDTRSYGESFERS